MKSKMRDDEEELEEIVKKIEILDEILEKAKEKEK